jgi:FkbM family methyltransferase
MGLAYLYSQARLLARRAFDRWPLLESAVARPLRRFVHTAERRFLGRRIVSPVELDGYTVHFRPEDKPLLLGQLAGGYEQETRQRIEATLRPGDTFVDVGANIGFFTLLASRRVGPEGRVIAFEAMPGTSEILRRNVDANRLSNVEVVNKAVLDRCGTVAFDVDDYSSGGSGLSSTERSHRRQLEVDACSLDAFFEPRGWPPLRLIKIDVEGAEAAAIAGLHGCRARHPGLELIVEVNERLHSIAHLHSALQAVGLTRVYALELGRPVDLTTDADAIRAHWRHGAVNLWCAQAPS